MRETKTPAARRNVRSTPYSNANSLVQRIQALLTRDNKRAMTTHRSPIVEPQAGGYLGLNHICEDNERARTPVAPHHRVAMTTEEKVPATTLRNHCENKTGALRRRNPWVERTARAQQSPTKQTSEPTCWFARNSPYGHRKEFEMAISQTRYTADTVCETCRVAQTPGVAPRADADTATQNAHRKHGNDMQAWRRAHLVTSVGY